MDQEDKLGVTRRWLRSRVAVIRGSVLREMFLSPTEKEATCFVPKIKRPCECEPPRLCNWVGDYKDQNG